MHELGWFTGCWQSENGASREVWAQEANILLGYSVDIKDEKIRFFEHMRLIKSDEGYGFIVSPFGGDWVTFTQEERNETSITFVNAENDYPQRIRYERAAKNLNAEISALDGSNPKLFHKVPCT